MQKRTTHSLKKIQKNKQNQKITKNYEKFKKNKLASDNNNNKKTNQKMLIKKLLSFEFHYQLRVLRMVSVDLAHLYKKKQGIQINEIL